MWPPLHRNFEMPEESVTLSHLWEKVASPSEPGEDL